MQYSLVFAWVVVWPLLQAYNTSTLVEWFFNKLGLLLPLQKNEDEKLSTINTKLLPFYLIPLGF